MPYSGEENDWIRAPALLPGHERHSSCGFASGGKRPMPRKKDNDAERIERLEELRQKYRSTVDRESSSEEPDAPPRDDRRVMAKADVRSPHGARAAGKKR